VQEWGGRAASPGEIARRVVDAAKSLAGGALTDDCYVLAARFTGGGTANARGGEGGAAAYFRRITPYPDAERLRASEKALRITTGALNTSEEQFRLLVEGVKDYGIFLLDPEGNVATWNAGAEQAKGYRAEEIIGQHFSRFYTPEDIAARHPQQELEIAAREGRYEEEGWRVRKDGSRFWANVVITALFDQEGELKGFGKVTRDVTERRRHEREQAATDIAAQQRRFLKEVLSSVTQGRLILCDTPDDLPSPMLPSEPAGGDPLVLTRQSLKTLRARVEAVAAVCAMPTNRTLDFITAVSECAMNAVQHADGGTASLYTDADAGIMQVWVEDQGRGIELSSLPRATLERGFSTGGSGFGHGFWLMLQTCDRVYLLTSEAGTTVVLEQERSRLATAWL